MFYNVQRFNQPLNNWNVSSVTDMHDMFKWAVDLEQLPTHEERKYNSYYIFKKNYSTTLFPIYF